MKANYIKTRILQILDEVIAYLLNKLRILKKSAAKNSIFQESLVKKVLNLIIFCKIILSLQNQLQKITHFNFFKTYFGNQSWKRKN